MFKRLSCLLLALVLALAVGTTALADAALYMLSANPLEGGYLSVIAQTEYTGETDMQFTANTENGDLEVINSSALRKDGTTWFVIMEYNYYYDNSHYAKTQERALKDIADAVTDKDNGALVRCDTDRVINLEQPDLFKTSLTKKHVKTKPEELLATLRAVHQYISDNPDKLKPNVAIVIVTACPSGKITEAMIQEIGTELENYNLISTHIIVTAAQGVHKQDRELGQMLIDRAYSTVAGTGYMTDKLTEDEADKGVQRLNDSERRKIKLFLDPETEKNIGHKLTLTQTLANGKQLVSEAELPDSVYDLWEKYIKDRPGKPIETPKINSYDAGSVFTGSVMKQVPQEKKSEGISTELLIGIIAGVVVLALLAALLITNANKKKKKQQSATPVFTGSSGGSSSGGPTITLSGANGSVLKGQMKGGKLTVGRNGAKAMLTVPSDGKLSGLHATFTKQGNQMMITDNGSTNGTKLNGNKIPAATPTPIHQNDTVTLGSTTYTISWR